MFLTCILMWNIALWKLSVIVKHWYFFFFLKKKKAKFLGKTLKN